MSDVAKYQADTPDRVLMFTDDGPEQGIKYCFAHSSKDLAHGKCTWCEKTVTEIVAGELKHE